MAAIKRTPADVAFSLCVRERSGWECERCHTQYPENARGLECSHHHSRGKWGLRFDPLNAEALCTGCHFLVGGKPGRLEEVASRLVIEVLQERANDIELGKQYRKTKGKGPIAAHFRAEYVLMKGLRMQGHTGRIEFESWL